MDSYRLRRPGVLLTDDREEKSQRLINVAVTRAKEKFVLVSNMKYWDSRWRSGETLHQLFDYLKVNGEVYNYEDIYENLGDMDIKNLDYLVPRAENEEESIVFFDNFVKDIINSNYIYLSVPESQWSGLELIEAPLEKAIGNNSKLIIQSENVNLIPKTPTEICK